METSIPIISVDDHVLEPPHSWTSRMPKKLLDLAPRVERLPAGEIKGRLVGPHLRDPWGRWPSRRLLVLRRGVLGAYPSVAAVGFQRDDLDETQMTYDDARPGCYLRPERLADMDVNGIEASLCFPNYSRFAGQHFLDVEDRELGLACVRAYNYWMVEEWCEGSGGRLIPPVHRAALGSRPGGRGGLPQSGSRCPSGVLHRAPRASAREPSATVLLACHRWRDDASVRHLPARWRTT